jgi:hypothetical protein
MTKTNSICDHFGQPLSIGDRVTAVAWGGSLPLALTQGYGVVVGFGRTRVRVQWTGEAYGGKWPEYRAIEPSLIRIAVGTRKAGHYAKEA